MKLAFLVWLAYLRKFLSVPGASGWVVRGRDSLMGRKVVGFF
jgi:hypothetical protein